MRSSIFVLCLIFILGLSFAEIHCQLAAEKHDQAQHDGVVGKESPLAFIMMGLAVEDTQYVIYLNLFTLP
jgi:hypothetical protein